MPERRPFRITVVAGGAILMIGAAVAAFGLNWVIYNAYPNFLGDRWFIVFPFAPLLAGLVLLAATNWTRHVRPSWVESLGPLVVVELMGLGIVALISGALWMEVVFWFWAAASVAFAPWWLLGLWLGRRLGRKRDNQL